MLSACSENTKSSFFSFDTSKNIYKEENNSRTVILNTLKKTVFVDSIGSLDSILVLDSTAIIGSIDKVQVADHHVYIIDKEKAKSVFCFAADGKLKWSYKKQGRGSGEYARLGDMQVVNGRVYLFDNLALKLIQLDTAGLFVREMKLPSMMHFFPDYFFVDTNSNFILYNEDFGDYEKFPYEFTVMDPDCKNILSCNYSQADNPTAGRWTTFLSPMSNFRHGEGFYLSKPLNDTIYMYKNGVFSRSWVVDFGISKVPDEVRSKDGFTLKDFQLSPYKSNIERIFDTDSIVSFVYGNGSAPGWGFINKQTNECISFSQLFFNINGHFQMFMPIGQADGKIIAEISPINIIRYFGKLKANNPGLTDQQLDEKLQKEASQAYRLRKKISPASNPVLVFLNFSSAKIFNSEKK